MSLHPIVIYLVEPLTSTVSVATSPKCTQTLAFEPSKWPATRSIRSLIQSQIQLSYPSSLGDCEGSEESESFDHVQIYNNENTLIRLFNSDMIWEARGNEWISKMNAASRFEIITSREELGTLKKRRLIDSDRIDAWVISVIYTLELVYLHSERIHTSNKYWFEFEFSSENV